MRHIMLLLVGATLATSLAVGCDDDDRSGSTPTAPSSPAPPSTPAPPPSTPPTGGGGGNQPPSGGSAPATAAVDVGDIFFKSGLNGSSNPAVDTVAVNGTVTWTWTGNLPHSVQSTGSPSFTSSGIQTGSGQTYQFQFTAPGTYQYDCAVHGQMMTGAIVVLAGSGSSSTSTPSTPPPSTPPPSTPSGY
jgi:plastocyanin